MWTYFEQLQWPLLVVPGAVVQRLLGVQHTTAAQQTQARSSADIFESSYMHTIFELSHMFASRYVMCSYL